MLLFVDESLVVMPNLTKVGMRSKQKSKSSARRVVLSLPTGARSTSAMSICSTTVAVRFPVLPPASSYSLVDSTLTGPNQYNTHGRINKVCTVTTSSMHAAR